MQKARPLSAWWVGGEQVYMVKKGDSLASIAGQFATTAKKLLSVNPMLSAQVSPNMDLEAGTPPSFRIIPIDALPVLDALVPQSRARV